MKADDHKNANGFYEAYMRLALSHCSLKPFDFAKACGLYARQYHADPETAAQAVRHDLLEPSSSRLEMSASQ